MNEAKIKACPFCDSKRVYVHDATENKCFRYRAQCSDCYSHGPLCSSEDKAREFWNAAPRAGDREPEAVQSSEAKGQFAPSTLLEGPTDDFRKEVEEMDETELRRRVLNQVTHIQAYQKCLDGLGLKYATDGHRRPDDIREIVKALTGPSNEKLRDGATGTPSLK